MKFLNFSILLVLFFFVAPSVKAADATCWKFPRPLDYNDTKIYLLTNSMVIGSTFNNLFPESSEKYEIDVNLYYFLDTPLASSIFVALLFNSIDSTSITLKDLDPTKSILLTIDEEAIDKLGSGGAGKEVPIADIVKLGEDIKLESIKESLNKLFVDLTISKSGIVSKVGDNNFTGIAWSCEESQAYVKEASTPLNITKCYKFINVGGKYGDYYAFVPTKRVYGGLLNLINALENTIKKLLPIEGIMPTIKDMMKGINVIASVDVDFIQATDITKINLTNIRQDTGIILTEDSEYIPKIIDECLEEGGNINQLINPEQIIRVANCVLARKSKTFENVLSLMSLFNIVIKLPTNITVDMNMITPFLPMVAEYFNGLYLNKDNKATLMLDVGDDVTVKAIGEEFDCSTAVDRVTLGLKEYISIPKGVNVIFPKTLLGTEGITTLDASNNKLRMRINSGVVKDKLPEPLNTGNYELMLAYTYTTIDNTADGETSFTVEDVDKAFSSATPLDVESKKLLVDKLGVNQTLYKWSDMTSLNLTNINSYAKEQLSKLSKISVKSYSVLSSSKKRGKGIFKINGGADQELDVYLKFPPEEFVIDNTPTSSPTSSPLPDDAKPLPRNQCYKFLADGGKFGTYYVNIKDGTVKGGINIENALQNIGDLIPPAVSGMISFKNIYAWAEVKLDYIDVDKVTKINVTEILESTYIQFTGLEDNAIVTLLGGMVPQLALLNQPIYLGDLLKNLGSLLAAIKNMMPDLEIPDGPLGLDNITQFLPLAYEYFDGMYWSESNKHAAFSVSVPPSTVVNAVGEVIDCTMPPSSGLPETIPVYNYIFSFRNNVPGIKGIFVINGKQSIINAKLNCSDYKHLLPESMQDLNCYISIKYDAGVTMNAEQGYSSFSVGAFSTVSTSEKNTVIKIEPRDEDALKKLQTIMKDTNPDDVIEHVCGSAEYRSLIDLSEVAESDKDTEANKILGNLYDSVRSNITNIFGMIYLKHANVAENGAGRVDLSTPGVYNVKVWTTTAMAEELECDYVIPPYDDDDDINKPTNPSDNMSSSVSLSYVIGLIMILLATLF